MGFDWDTTNISIMLLAKLAKPMGTARIVVNNIHIKGDVCKTDLSYQLIPDCVCLYIYIHLYIYPYKRGHLRLCILSNRPNGQIVFIQRFGSLLFL